MMTLHPTKDVMKLGKNATAALGKYVEHCFRKGIKPFPALAPSSLGGIITYISMHRSYIYPVQGRASCPPSKNDTTAEKYQELEN